MTSAMAAGVPTRPAKISDIVALFEATEAKPAERAPYKKQAA